MLFHFLSPDIKCVKVPIPVKGNERIATNG